VQLRGGSDELARNVAMQIASTAVQWISRDDVPQEIVSSEREIFASSDEVQSKPEQAREKIVEGMLGKRFFAERVLLDSTWIHDTSKTVAQVVGDDGAEILEFERFDLRG
jgi:elongation factor Ts